MKDSITISFDRDSLGHYTDSHVAALWHVAQANPAPIEDKDAGAIAEAIGREIIRRFLTKTAPELWAHQGNHHYWSALIDHCERIDGKWQPKTTSEAAQ